jgi:hypothetical protein
MKLKPFAVLILLFQTIASAAPTEHGPFTETNRPATVALRELKVTKDTENMICFRDTDADKTEVRVYTIEEGWPVYAEVIASHPGILQFRKTELSNGALHLIGVYTADLNLDGKPDYIINVPSGGNGLGAAGSYVGFLLSSTNDFTLEGTDTYCFDKADFILLKGKPRFVKSSYAWEKRCKDGKEHSFWIYNLLGFASGTIQEANDRYSGFPKIVWYNDAGNHEETTLLTARQKAELIKRSLPGEN